MINWIFFLNFNCLLIGIIKNESSIAAFKKKVQRIALLCDSKMEKSTVTRQPNAFVHLHIDTLVN